MNYRPMKKASRWDLESYVKTNYVNDIGDYHLRNIIELLEKKYTFYDTQFYKRQKQNPWWRLTFPFFLIYVIIITLSCPFKWAVNGAFGYEYESAVVRLYRAWQKRLNINW